MICRSDISIHSLIRGRTPLSSVFFINQMHFNPLPHTRENTVRYIRTADIDIFQSTPSYEGEPICGKTVASAERFQSTPSYEGEHLKANGDGGYKEFQSTPSYEGELRTLRIRAGLTQFQSTPSYEGELNSMIFNVHRKDFNPLPHTRENRTASKI